LIKDQTIMLGSHAESVKIFELIKKCYI